MTVNETANEMPQVPDSEDDVDHPNNLALEATAINQNFSQQILKRPTPQDSTDARCAQREWLLEGLCEASDLPYVCMCACV
jgi:hypothetical protein